jgi:hypothetical protein
VDDDGDDDDFDDFVTVILDQNLKNIYNFSFMLWCLGSRSSNGVHRNRFTGTSTQLSFSCQMRYNVAHLML